jgi:hypothetical protein
MNEHIKQLAEQAGLVRNGDIGMKRWEGPRSDSISDQDLEKFAELIVRECINIVAKRKDQAIDDSWNVDEAMSMAEMDLEEHFGVEL